MADPNQTSRRGGGHAGSLILRLLAAAGLGYDAYVHLHLAASFDAVRDAGTVSQGGLFRLEAVLAILAALLVLALSRRLSYALGFLVAAGGVVAVMLYRYVDVGRLGPLPDMYEPTWYAEKTYSAIAEALAALILAALLLRRARRAAPREPAA